MSRLSAAQPVPQEKLPAAGAVVEARGDAADAAATPPSRKARRSAPKQTRKSAAPKKGGKPALRRERIRAKKPRKIAALRMDDPDWPWPLHLCEMRQPIWKLQRSYRSKRLWNRSQGITGPDEAYRAILREWREENGY